MTGISYNTDDQSLREAFTKYGEVIEGISPFNWLIYKLSVENYLRSMFPITIIPLRNKIDIFNKRTLGDQNLPEEFCPFQIFSEIMAEQVALGRGGTSG